MHGDIGAPIQQGLFQFLDKQPLAARHDQGRGQKAIPLGGHADQLDLDGVMRREELFLYMFRLPQGQRTVACCNSYFFHNTWRSLKAVGA